MKRIRFLPRSFVFRYVRLSLVAGAALFAWCGPASSQEVLVTAYYPPMMMGDVAERAGYSVDIVKEAARRLGRTVTIQYYPFQRALKTVRNSPNAIQVSLFRNPEREPHYRWLATTHQEDMVFLTLGAPVDDLESARNLANIGVERGSGLDIFLTRNGFENLERVDRPETNARKLLGGRIDAWALARSSAEWTWKGLDIARPLVAGKALDTANVYAVTGLDFPAELAERYASTIRSMKADGTIDKIISGYLGND